jgi:hypothetical protein
MRRLEFQQRYFTDIGGIDVVTLASLIAMIGDVALKIRQTNKKTLKSFGVSAKVLYRYL